LRITVLILLALLVLLPSRAEEPDRLLVAVTVPSQAWLVEQIAGNQLDILTLVPEGHVPESSRPHPRVLARLQDADILFLVGHPYLYFEQRYVEPLRTQPKKHRWVSMYDVKKRLSSAHAVETGDPHLWTSPALVKASATELVEVLSELDRDNRETYADNLELLKENIAKLDARLRAVSEKLPGRQLLVYHPAWGNFCRDYGLQQQAIEVEGKAPGPGNLTAVLNNIDEQQTRHIISAPGSDQRAAAMIAEQGGLELVLLDPMDKDWMRMMQRMLSVLEMMQVNE
jgi:zinc transport system substrate-binding protein